MLLNYLLPMSLRTFMDGAKIWFTFRIYKDPELEGVIPRNSGVPEELGRIQFFFSDKTGTLTKNEMALKKLALEFIDYDQENIGEL